MSDKKQQQPDLESMSPEELMRWMENLAKSQGTPDKPVIDTQLAQEKPSFFSQILTRLRGSQGRENKDDHINNSPIR